MIFTYLWPLALVVLIPVIIIMYMLKQKAKEEALTAVEYEKMRAAAKASPLHI